MARGVIFTPRAAHALLQLELRSRKRGSALTRVVTDPSESPATWNTPYYVNGANPIEFTILPGGVFSLDSIVLHDALGRRVEVATPARVQMYVGVNTVYLKYWIDDSGSGNTSGHVWRLHSSTYDIREIEPQAIPLCIIHGLRGDAPEGEEQGELTASVHKVFPLDAHGVMAYPNGDSWTPGFTILNTQFDGAMTIAEPTIEYRQVGLDPEAEITEHPFYPMANTWTKRTGPKLVVRDGARARPVAVGSQGAASVLSFTAALFDYYTGNEIVASGEDSYREMFLDIYFTPGESYVYVPVHPDSGVAIDATQAFEDQSFSGSIEDCAQVARFKLIERSVLSFPRGTIADSDLPAQEAEDFQLGEEEGLVLFLAPVAYRPLAVPGTSRGMPFDCRVREGRVEVYMPMLDGNPTPLVSYDGVILYPDPTQTAEWEDVGALVAQAARWVYVEMDPVGIFADPAVETFELKLSTTFPDDSTKRIVVIAYLRYDEQISTHVVRQWHHGLIRWISKDGLWKSGDATGATCFGTTISNTDDGKINDVVVNLTTKELYRRDVPGDILEASVDFQWGILKGCPWEVWTEFTLYGGLRILDAGVDRLYGPTPLNYKDHAGENKTMTVLARL